MSVATLRFLFSIIFGPILLFSVIGDPYRTGLGVLGSITSFSM